MTQSCWSGGADSGQNVAPGNRTGSVFIDAAGNPDAPNPSDLMGLAITQITYPLRKNNNSNNTSTIQCALYSSDGTLQETSATSRTFADLSTTVFTSLSWTFDGSTTLTDGMIAGLINNAPSSTTAYFKDESGLSPNANPAMREYQSGSWNAVDRNRRLDTCITTSAAPSTGGTRLPPPPIVLSGF